MTVRNGALAASVTASAAFTGKRIIEGFPYHQLGVKVEMLVNTTWTDITSYVLVRDNISISPFGRTDETATMSSSQMMMTLDNRDGRFTPDNTSGAYYPYVQLNSQIRVSVDDVSISGVTYSGYRFWGEVSEWPPVWSPRGTDAYSSITVSGIFRRLSLGTSTIGSPYTRYNDITLAAEYTVAAYWPMEDGTGATEFATTTPETAANMEIVTGAPSFASCGNFRGSDALPVLSQAELSGTITTDLNPESLLFRFMLFPPTTGDPGAAGPVARIHLTGTLDHVDVVLSAGVDGPTEIQGFNSSGTMLFNGSTSVRMWGEPLLVQVGLTMDGSDIAWSLNMVEQLGTGYYSTTTGTIAGNVDDATSVIFNPGANFSGTAVGQAIVFYGVPSLTDAIPAMGGYQNEDATTRFERLCTEMGFGYETTGGLSGTLMGVQVDDTVVNVLEMIEQTDGGCLYETRDQLGLGYRTQASLFNQSTKLTLDYNQQQVGQPLTPVVDDSLTRNDITLTNWDGYTVEVTLENGPRSILNPPDGVGYGYEYQQDCAGMSHTQVDNLGIQILNCGTFSGSRYPNITANLARVTTASLFNEIPSMFIGDYLTIENMPVFGGPATQKQLVWGWTETINYNVWNIVWNTIPEQPWESSYNPGTYAANQIPGSPTTWGGTGTITGAMIGEGAIIGQNLAAGAVSGGNIADATITATNIALATITGDNIADGSITGTQIGAATIEGSNIDTGTITGGPGGNIAAATITGTQIASGTITGGSGGNIASATITGSDIGTATIQGGVGGNIDSGTITANEIENATITTTQISPTAGITSGQVAFTAADIGGVEVTFSGTAPSSPNIGDLWMNTSNGNLLSEYTTLTVTAVGTPSAPAVTTSGTGTVVVTGAWSGTQPRTSGDLLVAVVTAWGTTSAAATAENTGTTGWTKQYEDTGEAESKVAIWTKTAAGTDAAPAFTSSISGTSASTALECLLLELTTNATVTVTPGVATGGTAHSGNVATLTVTAGANTPTTGCLAIAAAVEGASSAGTVTFTRSGSYTNIANDGSTSQVAHANFDVNVSTGSGSAASDVIGWTSGTYVAACGAILVASPGNGWQPYQFGTSAIEDNAITQALIQSGAVGTSQIAAGAVTGGTGGSLAANTITAGNIVNATITNSQISSSAGITGGQIASGTITATNITSATITNTQISGTAGITGSQIASGTITGGGSGNIASATITGTQIAGGTITGSNIGSGTVTASNITSGTITNTQIASGTITGSNIGSGQITATNIASGTITASQISSSAGITGSQIAGGTISASNITSATITNTQIAGGTITGSNIGSATITGANLTNATITSTQIANGTITTTQISNSAGITAGQVGFTAYGLGAASVFSTGTTPYDWSLSPSTGGTTTFVTAATVLTQSSPMAVGDTFTDATSSRGGPFTVTAISAPSGGNVTVTFTPTASSSISTSDTLHGGTNGSLWYNTSSANALSVWSAGAWTLSQFGAGAISAGSITTSQIAANTITSGNIASATITGGDIAASTITASNIQAATITASQIASGTITATQIASGTITGTQIAATTITASNIASGTITATQIASGTITAANITSGIVIAGVVDGTTVNAGSIVADGTQGQVLVYNGTPGGGNLVGSWSGVAGTDTYGNTYVAGLSVNQGEITGIDIDSVTITNSTFQGDLADNTTLANPQITGGSITETNIEFDSTGGQLLVYTSSTSSVTETTGGQYSWTVPSDVTSAQVQLWAAGGGGNGGSTTAGGKGGGGGEYAAELTYAVTPGADITYVVGSGGTGTSTGGGNGSGGGDSFFDSGGVYANGGNGDGTPGTGSTNSVHENGGTGGAGDSSGGAGSGANSGNISSSGNNGITATTSSGAAAPSSQSGSGTGGAGGSSGANGTSGGSPGAGGGGAGKGTSTNTKTVTYGCLWTGSYYGPDADGNTPNGLRSTSTFWGGGETADGGAANGNQRSVFAFNQSQMASDFSGYTMQSITITLTNRHSWYSDGMTFRIDGYGGLPSSAPSSFPSGDYVGTIVQAQIAEGDTHTYGLPVTIANQLIASSLNGFGIDEQVAGLFPYNLSWYGYFAGGAGSVTVTMTGTTSGGGSFTAGNGSDGKAVITYTTGQTLVAAISPSAGTDTYGNSFVAGGSFYTVELYGTATTPSTPTASNAVSLFSSHNGTPNFITTTGYTAAIPGTQGNIQAFTGNSSGATNVTAAFSIPANDANVGTVYRLIANGYGTYSSGGTNWFGITAFGNTGAGQLRWNNTTTVLPGNYTWTAIATITVTATGSSGTANYVLNMQIAGSGQNNGTNVWNCTAINGYPQASSALPPAAISINTTSSTTMALQFATNGTASTTGMESTFERIGA